MRKAKDFMNCVKPCLLKNEDNEEVIDVVCLPELHLYIGAVNSATEARVCLAFLINEGYIPSMHPPLTPLVPIPLAHKPIGH